MAFALRQTGHIAITPSVDEVANIRSYAAANQISLDRVEFVIEPSDRYLPRCEASDLDLVLILGKHAFPCASPSVKSSSMEYLDSNSRAGVPMPRYLSQHTLACLTRQGAETLAQRMQGGGPARAERVLVNMIEGKMFAEFRSDSRETLEAWLKAEGMHFDWIVRIEWETREGKLHIAD